MTNAYPTTSNRLSSAAIGDVAHTFMHDMSGHITHHDACSDPDATDCVADDTFIGWNARGLAEKMTLGDGKTDTTPTARDSFRYGPDGARYFKKTEWAVTSGATTTTKTVAQVLRGRVREDGDGRRRHGGAHAHRRHGGAREDERRGHDGTRVIGVRVCA